MDSQSQQTVTADRTESNGNDRHSPTETTFGKLITEQPRHARVKHRVDGVIVWLIASLTFLGYLAFGSVTVQVWRFSEFLQQYYPVYVRRRILHIWMYQANQLPDVRFSWLLHVAYYASLFVCIAGTIYGVWLLLDRAGTGAAAKPASRRPPMIEG